MNIPLLVELVFIQSGDKEGGFDEKHLYQLPC